MRHIIEKVRRILEKSRCRDGHQYAAKLKQRQWFARMGERCYVDFSVHADEPYLVSMGDNVWLTDGVRLLTHDGALSMLSRVTGESLRKFGAVRFGNNVFVGMNSLIMPGVTIGNNCVVATGSVVTRDVPDGSIVGGNPAREIGTSDQLLAKWREKQQHFTYTSQEDKQSVLMTAMEGGLL